MHSGREDITGIQGAVQALLGTRRPIAVVDDNSDDQFFLRRELQFLFGDMPVISFRGGAALLHYLQEPHGDDERPWLILLDLHMMGMDGFRTLEVLHGSKGLAEIPVVVVSGTLDKKEIRAAYGYGAKAFLPKPLSRWDFIRILNGKPGAHA